MENVRIIEMPDCKMVTSGPGMFGEERFDRFGEWMSGQPRGLYSSDFLGESSVPGKFEWFYLYKEGMDTGGFEVVDFRGGLYAVVAGIDAQSNAGEMAAVDALVARGGFEYDRSRPQLGNILNTPKGKRGLGYNQMDYFVPVKLKGE